jgi:hypothetical protein
MPISLHSGIIPTCTEIALLHPLSMTWRSKLTCEAGEIGLVLAEMARTISQNAFLFYTNTTITSNVNHMDSGRGVL